MASCIRSSLSKIGRCIHSCSFSKLGKLKATHDQNFPTEKVSTYVSVTPTDLTYIGTARPGFSNSPAVITRTLNPHCLRNVVEHNGIYVTE